MKIKKTDLESSVDILIHHKKTISNKTNLTTRNFYNEIISVSKMIQHKIYIVLRDEISRFNDIVRSFEYPFSSEPAFIEIYKKELLNYIEDKIEKNFLHRISSELSSPILELQNKIQDFALHTVKDGKDGVYFVEHKASIYIEWYHHFDISSLCSDFNADISFKFFFNPMSLIKCFYSMLYPTLPNSCVSPVLFHCYKS
uniref:Mitofusin-1 (Trinotate prediction) n=1 Tax=Henneguya salminicola TaxID=69463 RepID=A0A6G3MET2_HENSL